MPADAVLTGWGRTAPSRASVASPGSAEEVAALLERAPDRGVLGRGLGRAYGDAAQNGGGLVLDMRRLDRILRLDKDAAEAHVEAGMSFDALIRALVPRGLFVPVSPGTRQVTVGGAIAADVHGKNHHVDGSIGRHLSEITLVTAAGDVRRLTPGDDAFAATLGGMGLTGVVTSARIRLKRIETSSLLVDTERARDLDDLLARMTDGDHRYGYTVAWIDCLARGAALGRGVLTRGDFAPRSALPEGADPLRFTPRAIASVPVQVPRQALNRPLMRAFNAAWYLKAPAERRGELQSIGGFFHPLDGVGQWNRLYGAQGLVQYQVVVPFGREDLLRRMIERLSAAGAGSLLAVLKRFGPGGPMLSFPQAGWTLALDMPAGVRGLRELLDELDEEVAGAGGRVYLAKDARVRPELLERMYPELDRWRAVRAQLDPDGVLSSDLGRRLGLSSPSRKEPAPV